MSEDTIQHVKNKHCKVLDRRKMFDLFIQAAEKILYEKYAKGPVR
jgi:hypothetical protein